MVIDFAAIQVAATAAIALIAGLFTAFMFVVLNPRSDRIPRWAAYVAGVSTILAAYALLRLLVYGDWRSVVELCIVILAVAIAPTVGRVWLLYQDHQTLKHQRLAQQDILLARAQAVSAVTERNEPQF